MTTDLRPPPAPPTAAPASAPPPNGTSSKLKAGHFQTIVFSTEQIVINDTLYGEHVITEPVLLALLQCPTVLRLATIHQHGVTGMLGHTPRVTRLEHSVGVMLMVRGVGGSVAEQVAGLLHDVSHTVLSHVIDWAFSGGGRSESYHEVHKDRYVATTPLPAILQAHGLATSGEGNVLDEEQFGLVEQHPPHLCADRLDYGLRDAVAFGYLDLADARAVLADLSACPGPAAPGRLLVLADRALALTLARSYIATDQNVWSSPANVDLSRRTGTLIARMVARGVVAEDDLWRQSDAEFWAALRAVADPDEAAAIAHIDQGLPPEEGLWLHQGAKVRILDPDVVVPGAPYPQPLSAALPAWAAQKAEYVRAREAQRR